MALRYKTKTTEQKLANVMIFTIVVLAIIYCCMVLSIIFSAIERKQDLLAIKDITSKISYSENDYADKVASIDSTALEQKGFVKINNATFAVRKDPIASFSLLYER